MSRREQTRRDEFARVLSQENLDGYLIVDPVNVSYLTGFNGDDSYLWIGDSGACLLSDTRFAEQIKEESPDVGAFIRKSGETTIGLLKAAVADKNYSSSTPKRVGIESDSTNLTLFAALQATFPNVEFVPRSSDVERLREIKDQQEIDAIREAIDVTIDAYRDVRKTVASELFMTEVDLRDELEYRMRKRGGDDLSFPSIVAFDERAALPHAIPTRGRALAESRLVLIDWGAKKNWYVGDLTRAFLTERALDPADSEGKAFLKKYREIFEIVLHAHDAAIDAMAPGVPCDQIDKIARDAIFESGYGDYFGHGLGHCIGRVVHDYGGLSPRAKGTLKPGMVVTVEPGIYLPGWGGIRIEDDVLVGEDGIEILSKRLAVDE